MREISAMGEIRDKKVLLRVDFDVPVSERGEIQEKFRIEKQKPMINYLVDRGAKVVMVAHISDPDVSSFGDLIPQLHMLLGREIRFIKNFPEVRLPETPEVLLLENIRKFDGEIGNNKELARKLSKGFDIYINNDFAVCHRNHASVSAITGFLPSYAGLLIKEEVVQLQKAVDTSKAGKVVIIGGAKAEFKAPVIKNFVDKAEWILLGGVIANGVLKEKGQDIGNSIVDENSKELFAGLDIHSSQLLVPEDFVVFDKKILDIGDKTIQKYTNTISRASTIIWTGPMGLFENPAFATGTNELAKAIINSSAYKIMGGGDTISAVDKLGLLGKFDFVSTGGGAMLAFLAGQRMPGLEALGYYD